jgi:uncharacterized RDD family membrane protein YckC
VNRGTQASEAPAGFWHRYAAWSLDWAFLGAMIGLLVVPLLLRAWSQLLALYGLVEDWVYDRVVAANGVPSPLAMSQEILVDPALRAAAGQGIAALSATISSILALVFGLSALYFVIAEASVLQGTPGKRLLKLRVRGVDGGDIGFLRALLRHVSGAISWMLLNLGHAMAGWRRDKRALHDLIAGTQVVAQAPMPSWARWWLRLQALALALVFFGTLGWFGWTMYQFSQL